MSQWVGFKVGGSNNESDPSGTGKGRAPHPQETTTYRASRRNLSEREAPLAASRALGANTSRPCVELSNSAACIPLSPPYLVLEKSRPRVTLRKRWRTRVISRTSSSSPWGRSTSPASPDRAEPKTRVVTLRKNWKRDDFVAPWPSVAATRAWATTIENTLGARLPLPDVAVWAARISAYRRRKFFAKPTRRFRCSSLSAIRSAWTQNAGQKNGGDVHGEGHAAVANDVHGKHK